MLSDNNNIYKKNIGNVTYSLKNCNTLTIHSNQATVATVGGIIMTITKIKMLANNPV